MTARKRKHSKEPSAQSKRQKEITTTAIPVGTSTSSSKSQVKSKHMKPKMEVSAISKPVKAKRYGIAVGLSPYPDWPHPTLEECQEVCRLLTSVHGDAISPKAIQPPSLRVAGCGEVPAVHDALLRTRLSAATTTTNANNAIGNVARTFGIAKKGVAKGSIDWDAVRLAPRMELLEAIKCGGLAATKSNDIKLILDMIFEENKTRRDAMDAEGKKPSEADLDPLSLEHLQQMPSDEAYSALIRYPSIGVKTAACVLLFCLQRPCFAVDTHVWRMCKWLGWVPPKANEVNTFAHCQVRIPDELKYSLHQLFFHHGRACVRCKASTGQGAKGWDDGCVIDHLVTRTGNRKAAGDVALVPVKTEAKVVPITENLVVKTKVAIRESPARNNLRPRRLARESVNM